MSLPQNSAVEAPTISTQPSLPIAQQDDIAKSVINLNANVDPLTPSNMSKFEIGNDLNIQSTLNILNSSGSLRPEGIMTSTATDHFYKWGSSHKDSKVLSLDDLSGMSQADLIFQVLKAQRKIQQLEKSSNLVQMESSCSPSDPEQIRNPITTEHPNLLKHSGLKVEESSCGIFINNLEDISGLEITIVLPNNNPDDSSPKTDQAASDVEILLPECATRSDLHLIESPLVTTPPYEYIILTKENEPKVRIYLNPRMEKAFRQEITHLRNGHSMSVVTAAATTDSHGLNGTNICSISSNEKHETSIADRVFGTGATVHCFDPSDVDLQLKKFIMDSPPVTHKIIRRKPRKERGSSVPAIDSYYGTKDLAMVGHASYFIPMLTATERKAIGWKDEYRYGKWKYSAPNIPFSSSGHIPIRPTHSMKVKSSHHAYTKVHHQPGSDADSREHLGRLSITSQKILQQCHSPCLTEPTQEQLNVIEEEARELSFITLSNSKGSKSCHMLRDKHGLKRFLRWLVPCMKSKKSSAQNDQQDDSSSGESEYEDEMIVTQGSMSEGTEVKVSKHDHDNGHSHHHHHHSHGCFPHRHSHKIHVTGGDVIDSAKNSALSVAKKSESMSGLQPQELPTIEYKPGDEPTIQSLAEDIITSFYGVQKLISGQIHVEETPGTIKQDISMLIKNCDIVTDKKNKSGSETVEVFEVISQNCVRQSDIHQGQKIEPHTSELPGQFMKPLDLEMNMFKVPIVPYLADAKLWSSKFQNDCVDSEDNFSSASISEYSDFPSTLPFPSTSTEFMKNTVSTDPYDVLYDDVASTGSTMNGVDFYDDLQDEVYEYDPGCDYSSIPESRFLDPKDELSPRYANSKVAGIMASEYYGDEDDDDDLEMNDDHYNYIPSDESDNDPSDISSAWEEQNSPPDQSVSINLSEISATPSAKLKPATGVNNNVNNNTSTGRGTALE